MRFGIAIGTLGLLATIVTGASAVAQSVRSGPSDHGAAPARGVIRAIDQAAFSTELQARVAVVGFREGEAFKAGDVLVEFDCRRSRAEAAAAEAAHQEARLTLESNLHLARHNAVGRHDLEISRTRVAKSAAEAEALASRLDQCRVVAPFDGRVAEIAVHAHEMAPAAKPYLAIVGDRRLEIELIIPSSWLTWMKPGQAFDFLVDETRLPYPARVTRVGAAIDPVSQSIKIYGEFVEPPAELLPGMSGVSQLTLPRG